jgi:hypothetical protein
MSDPIRDTSVPVIKNHTHLGPKPDFSGVEAMHEGVLYMVSSFIKHLGHNTLQLTPLLLSSLLTGTTF